MVISIRDSENNISDGAQATSLLACVSAIGKSKKTLALQLTGPTEDSILNMLIGASISNSSMSNEIYSFEDDGIDGLFLRVNTAELSKEHYDECVTPLLEKENMLDILRVTKNTNWKGMMPENAIHDILEKAETVYDYIFVLVENEKKSFVTKTVTELADENLILVKQGHFPTLDIKDDRTFIVIKDFERDSKYTINHARKMFDAKTIYCIEHNVSYKDAIISRNTLNFFLKNRKCDKTDVNYTFVEQLYKLVERYISNKEVEEDETLETVPKDKPVEIMGETPDFLTEDAFQEVETKKGLFGKKKTRVFVNIRDDASK